jgi:pilus assembly protein CpaC
VKLDFTPTVEEDGSVTLKVAPEVSQLDFTNPLALNGFDLPTVVTRKSETTVNLAAGEYLVIGGLRQEEKSKNVHRVPILGQIPLLGFFFSSTSYSVTNRDLMVVVSPDVLAGGSAQMPELPTDRPEQK